MTEHVTPTLRLATIYDGVETEWVTIIEDGIPKWIPVTNDKKKDFLEQISSLLEHATDDEPIILITTDAHTYELTYFESAGLYLCEDLEGRYASLETIVDALWEVIQNEEILEMKRM